MEPHAHRPLSKTGANRIGTRLSTRARQLRVPATEVRRECWICLRNKLRLLELTHQTGNELKQLTSTVQRPQLISALGYAFHVLPDIAHSGGWESDSFFPFNFR
jgi:hypothetical protein